MVRLSAGHGSRVRAAALVAAGLLLLSLDASAPALLAGVTAVAVAIGWCVWLDEDP